MENLKEILDESRPPAHIHLSRTGEVVKEEEIKPKSTLQPPPTDGENKEGSYFHNLMMYAYNGNAPITVKWYDYIQDSEVKFARMSALTFRKLEQIVEECGIITSGVGGFDYEVEECVKYIRYAIQHHLEYGMDKSDSTLTTEEKGTEFSSSYEPTTFEAESKSTLQPPPIDNYGIGTLTHNAMMKVYKGVVPNIAKWPSCLFHAEKMVWVDINWADKDHLWGILNECDSVLVSETSPSVKTFAHYLKGVVVDYLHDNDHPDLPEIPDSVPPSIKYMMKEALKGCIPGLQEDWAILPLDEIEFVHICKLDAVGLSSLKVECVNLTICADCAKTDSSLISYATFLLEILKFDHEHPHYFYNLESD